MQPTRIVFTDDGRTQYAGYADYILVSPDGNHTIELKYKGEPPHGDSYHDAIIDGSCLPGLAWGGAYGFSRCSRYAVFGWMSKRYERRTIAIDMTSQLYFVLPEYIDQFCVQWPVLLGADRYEGRSYTFTGNERWVRY
jgi:hypothetical protein